MRRTFPHTHQLDSVDCGPACLKMIAKYYGKEYSIQHLRERSYITRMGVSMLGISEAAESIGFHTNGVKITFKQLIHEAPLPCILHWNQHHFVVCYNIKKKHNGDYTIRISDPASGKQKSLAIGQYQQLGSVFFSQTTSLLISFIAAKAVVEGNITLGMMMSISYIIGQLSAPISQVIGFLQSAQDAKNSQSA